VKPYYDHSGITIYHGNCRAICPELPTDAAVVADPPYGINFQFNKKRTGRRTGLDWGRGGQVEHDRGWLNVAGDDSPFEPEPWSMFGQAILWGANNYSHKLPPSRCWLVWDKRDGSTPDDHGDCELAWTSLAGPIRQFSHLWRGIVRAGEENVANGPKLHPCQKPLALMRWCVSMTSGTVIDPYMGSGTTLRAAKDLGRRAIGIEIEEKYCEIAARRMEQEVLFPAEAAR
jgi:site-specific DNA-methyltransferase (adenine-specific)/modification methylase